jgi:hypothetical protein
MRFKILFISSLLMILVQSLLAQERCGTVQYEKLLELKNPDKEKNLQFENWINQKLTQSATKQLKQQRTGSATYEIPVVVHIIHNGEPIGTGTNISDNQILSQINVLNKDFKRLNTDAGNTPAEFLSAAGSLDIEFILAKQDPYGAPTTGIERVQGTKSVWTINDNAVFKALSYWPAEDYYNIWVINMPTFLGYAQLPVSNLPGLENSPDDRLTDGTIVHYAAFGSNFEGLGSFSLLTDYDHGRTATHETGHFFGLRHIWGDDGTSCSGTDYVNDTPNQAGDYSGQCPTNPRASCSSNDMFMNYMDYTDDACMNLFTQGQFSRAIVVLDNSPRRFSLRNSIGDESPPPLANDLALRKILSPGVTSCGGSVIPSLEIQNLGTSTATSAQLQLKVNAVVVETKDVVLNLTNLAITTVAFNPVSQPSGSANYEFDVLSVNGGTDERTTNDYLTISSTIPASGTLPITEVFNSFPANWSRNNPDNNIQWAIKNTSSNGNAMYVNCYDYENQGAVDRLITPVLDLTTESVALLKFDRAHAMYSTNNQERLRVLVSAVCDFDNTSTEVLNLLGPALATAPQTTSQFVPNATQWTTETISLNSFVGSKIQIAFEVTNGWGNDVYLDNVVVLTDEFIDLAILSIVSPGPVTCLANPNPVIRVKNLGSTLITSFKAVTSVNNQTQPQQTISNISIAPGSEQSFTLNPIPLTSTSSTLVVTISEPGGFPDANVNNNSIFMKSIYNDYRDVIPLRQNFNEFYTDQWPVISQGNDATWIPFATNKLYSLAYPAYSGVAVGDESWIVSPVLDFSNSNEASVFFDISYATQPQGDERLRILYSDDCGQTYPNVLYDKSGSLLSTTNTSQSWIPTKDEDWDRRSLNLNALAGKENIRIAFVATSDSGNNLFIDDVEFYIADDLSPVSIENQYEVYGVGSEVKLTFNLTQKETVFLKIYNMLGQPVLEDQLHDVLNQTYTFDIHQQGTGIYIIWVQFANQVGSSKVFLTGSN